ncbi:hypothetical protein D3C83_234770 [compost metagenome]
MVASPSTTALSPTVQTVSSVMRPFSWSISVMVQRAVTSSPIFTGRLKRRVCAT